jgi:outer membrane lipoprotein-sorting protein
MLKKFLPIIFLLILTTACNDGLRAPADSAEVSAFERVQRMLMELENYRAIATVEYRSNKGTNTYETIQHAKISGEYRVEVTAPEHVAGSVTTSNNQQIFQFNSRVNGRVNLMVQETPERSEIFLTSFIKNYLQSEEISVSVSDMEEGVRTVLEATLPGEHPYLSTARLWVDNESLVPVKLIIFDRDGAERIIVTYHVFEKNVELNDALFTL